METVKYSLVETWHVASLRKKCKKKQKITKISPLSRFGHSREGGNPLQKRSLNEEIPAYAGMTAKENPVNPKNLMKILVQIV